MRTPADHHHQLPPLIRVARRCLVIGLATALAAGCDYPFEPFQESQDGAFSMFGYLNTKADTQWVRVMPVRQSLFLQPEPIDAVVTLEHVGSGHTVTLNDSLFTFRDAQLEGVAYAYNFWTAEPLEPGATYRLRAVRSDGAAATATVVMPPAFEMTFAIGPAVGLESAVLRIRAPKLLFVDVFFAMSDTDGGRAESIVIREGDDFPTGEPGVRGIVVSGDTLLRDGLLDARRQEIRLAVAPADWPFSADLPDLAVSLPGTAPSNVDNGLGYVAGVTAWTLPFHRCALVAGDPDGENFCTTTFNQRSASIEGELVREPCGEPGFMVDVFLTETRAGGRAITRSWKSGWDGDYRFEGIEPGAGLLLQIGAGTPALRLPALAPGERHVVGDIALPCSAPGSAGVQ